MQTAELAQKILARAVEWQSIANGWKDVANRALAVADELKLQADMDGEGWKRGEPPP
jgi:hypothetical protein